jgi:hypothetical protein
VAGRFSPAVRSPSSILLDAQFDLAGAGGLSAAARRKRDFRGSGYQAGGPSVINWGAGRYQADAVKPRNRLALPSPGLNRSSAPQAAPTRAAAATPPKRRVTRRRVRVIRGGFSAMARDERRRESTVPSLRPRLCNQERINWFACARQTAGLETCLVVILRPCGCLIGEVALRGSRITLPRPIAWKVSVPSSEAPCRTATDAWYSP